MGLRTQRNLPKGMAASIRIEAHVTHRCNAICTHCNAGVGYVSFADTDMTVQQMKKAVDMLIDQRIHVPRFTFCGGEPVLNRNLQGLIDQVARLPTLMWGRVLTNGMPVSQKLRDKIQFPDGRFFWVPNPLDDPNDPLSGKNDRRKRPNARVHSPFWISPADVGMEANFAHCRVQGWCGIGLSVNGFEACGKMAMFSKLLGVENTTLVEGDIIKHIKTPVEDVCKHCQYGLVGGLKDERIIHRMNKRGELPDVSPTFAEAFANHNKNGDKVQLAIL